MSEPSAQTKKERQATKLILDELEKNGTAERVVKAQAAIEGPLFQRELIRNFRRDAGSRIDEIKTKAIDLLGRDRKVDLKDVELQVRLDPSGSLVHLRAVPSDDAIERAKKSATKIVIASH